jgi:import inner membrane translocase subunit TIM23
MTSKNNNYEFMSNPDLGDQLAFTAGMTYISGFFLGLTFGIFKGFLKSNRMPTRLKISKILNSIGTETSRGANAFGSIGVVYFFTGKILNACFEDLLDYFNNTSKNMLCGAFTGAIYKSTLGWRPTLFGSVLGSSFALGISLLMDYGNTHGYIGFSMGY